ncbi:MAG: RiPP maturation radical SAM protein 1 [Desulfobacterales bacterium]|nr:RiPP maturation radical SAM protein 1 [Desulfobacterales bacterium]
MIYFINMPFASISYPNIAPALFKAQCKQARIECRVLDLNLLFARLIGYNGYQKIGRFMEGDFQLGEWLFAPYAWNRLSGSSDHEFLQRCVTEIKKISRIENPETWIKMIRNTLVPDFLKKSLDIIQNGDKPRVVGFTCSFFQLTASLALGKLIKKELPQTRLVYGGANFHSLMGRELIQKIEWIDAVSTGEADDVIIPLVSSLSEGDPVPELQGILFRDSDGTLKSGSPYSPVTQEVFESLPDPDYTDFFATAHKFGWDQVLEWKNNIHLFLEGSRGCWWGQKCQCTYCGLNGDIMKYRLKPGKRVYETIANFVEKYNFTRIQPTDNNMNKEYFNTLLPRLSQKPFQKKLKLLYEVKATLNRNQIQAMADAGVVYLHPGIENFSTHILKLIRKGIRGIQNIYFLKLCREFGIITLWNFLVRVPGERIEDYREQEELIPRIIHLQPPCRGRTSNIECVRFSPYFFEKGWCENIRPKSWYYAIFPQEDIDISRVAYFFDADWNDVLDKNAYKDVNAAIGEWCRIWIQDQNLPRLAMKKDHADGTILIEDTRVTGRPETYTLDPEQGRIYELIRDPLSLKSIIRKLGFRKLGSESLSNPDGQKVAGILNEFLKLGLAVREKHTYLGLALPHDTPEPSVKNRWVVE